MTPVQPQSDFLIGAAIGAGTTALAAERGGADFLLAINAGRLIKRINPDTRFLLEGGPIASAEELGRVASLAPIDGYVGGSTFERIPLEDSVADQIHRFRHASRRGAKLDAASARLVAWSGQFGFIGRSREQLELLRRLRALRVFRGLHRHEPHGGHPGRHQVRRS